MTSDTEAAKLESEKPSEAETKAYEAVKWFRFFQEQEKRIATLEKELAIERQRSEVRGKSLLEATAEVERLKKENEIKLDKWLDHGSDMMEELERLRPENKRLQSKLAKTTAALTEIAEYQFRMSDAHIGFKARETLAEIGK